MARRYSAIEKELIREICQRPKVDSAISYIEGGLVNRCLAPKGESVWLNDEECRYTCTEKENYHTVERDIEIIAYLLYSLERDYYIDYYKTNDYRQLKTLNGYYLNTKVCTSLETSNVVLEMLSKDLQCDVKINQSLYDLVDNNFQTEEDKALDEAKKQTQYAFDTFRDSKRQTKYVLWTFVATLIMLLISVVTQLRCCST